jgi:hypothetical protein
MESASKTPSASLISVQIRTQSLPFHKTLDLYAFALVLAVFVCDQVFQPLIRYLRGRYLYQFPILDRAALFAGSETISVILCSRETNRAFLFLQREFCSVLLLDVVEAGYSVGGYKRLLVVFAHERTGWMREKE